MERALALVALSPSPPPFPPRDAHRWSVVLRSSGPGSGTATRGTSEKWYRERRECELSDEETSTLGAFAGYLISLCIYICIYIYIYLYSSTAAAVGRRMAVVWISCCCWWLVFDVGRRSRSLPVGCWVVGARGTWNLLFSSLGSLARIFWSGRGSVADSGARFVRDSAAGGPRSPIPPPSPRASASPRSLSRCLTPRQKLFTLPRKVIPFQRRCNIHRSRNCTGLWSLVSVVIGSGFWDISVF